MKAKMSHFAWSAWIEIAQWTTILKILLGRTSHEVRGLKYFLPLLKLDCIFVALRMKCVDWNKIVTTGLYLSPCRTSHEVRGLKLSNVHFWNEHESRTSHEVRGLKLLVLDMSFLPQMSHFAWSAWIEIRYRSPIQVYMDKVALRMKCVDWNLVCFRVGNGD